jgi:hypothetical protein
VKTESDDDALGALQLAVADWVDLRKSQALRHWLGREVGGEGLPRTLPIAECWRIWQRVWNARVTRPERWPAAFDESLANWLATILRFSRPDGSLVFGAESGPDLTLIRRATRQLPDTGARTVIERWLAGRRRARGGRAAPPLPAIASTKRPLAVLRADWSIDGDIVAVDHRNSSPVSAVEIFGAGRRWLGPDWAALGSAAESTRPRPSQWTTSSTADYSEWKFELGTTKLTRCALYFRGRGIALLADERVGTEPAGSMSVGLAPNVSPTYDPKNRAILLKGERRGRACQVVPLALPALRYASDRGALSSEAGNLLLRQRISGRRAWLPLLCCWDPDKLKRTLHWRVLTVVERSKICPPDVAFAARVGWGRGEGLVIYRSLSRPALRSFLGYQTSARFFVGTYSQEGDVEPLLTIE